MQCDVTCCIICICNKLIIIHCRIFSYSCWRKPTLNFLYFCRGVSTWQLNIVFVMCSRHQRQIRDLFVMCSRYQSYLSWLFECLQQVSATARFSSVSFSFLCILKLYYYCFIASLLLFYSFIFVIFAVYL